MTHRFHPLYGRDFEFVVHRRNWGEDRVYCRDEDGELFSLPAAWTDAAPVDPFVVIAAGRCSFTADCGCRKSHPRDATRRYSLIRPPMRAFFSDAVLLKIDRFG